MTTSPAMQQIGLYGELERLARLIDDAKSEIAALRTEDIRDKHLAVANDELDAIVGATAEATHAILDAVEEIEKLAAALPEPADEGFTAHVVAIYQACSFQDITGQRINKVVRTLKQIEAKVDQLLGAFGDDAARQRSPAIDSRDDGLLDGPQRPGAGASQADIDALFAKP